MILSAEIDGIKEARLNRKMRAQKRDEMPGRGEVNGEKIPLSQIVLKPEETPRLLKKVYEAADFEKPKNLLGFLKNVPDEEMRAMILHNERGR